ncbi:MULTISPECIES: cupin domain-containing protein [unclassified Pseudomonas]|uniref:cupin domain-containing protein n=1 Tax=unclassified Pseudomonas TaxID=196821 RepID=UPI000BD74DCA|nr:MULTISPECIES: cupin domain-containing protein [unclassified Pseudomonas]PVZ19727.1 XRE family transcriptional regulator [Pseudomonas sp. URIL14HWK12:I12]PVZ22688.1 XRE family transcriptional regulator [Pseudomonas sp. URIL14HWK12:I10]PVZ37682.1 XRE family transcriptional regulator [Pseudomonas sp. URIL14HWK12:I11]SNZ15510.1 transcriptional regulator, XRE family with cupin sensor [Pseudomonas sp. URIL14HWK12:I9]
MSKHVKAQHTNGLPNLGLRLRHARKVAGLTLKQVAEAAGCSESLISKLENEAASPSLAMLHRLAGAVGSNVSELTSEQWASDEPVLRAGKRQVSRFAHGKKEGYIDLERITHPHKGGLLQGDIYIVTPGMVSELIEHAGEEMGYVIEGHIDLTIGNTTYSLKPGDSFHFSSSVPHGYRNNGDVEARILWVNTPATF